MVNLLATFEVRNLFDVSIVCPINQAPMFDRLTQLMRVARSDLQFGVRLLSAGLLRFEAHSDARTGS